MQMATTTKKKTNTQTCIHGRPQPPTHPSKKKTPKRSQNETQTKLISIEVKEHPPTTTNVLGSKELMETTWCKINWCKEITRAKLNYP